MGISVHAKLKYFKLFTYSWNMRDVADRKENEKAKRYLSHVVFRGILVRKMQCQEQSYIENRKVQKSQNRSHLGTSLSAYLLSRIHKRHRQ